MNNSRKQMRHRKPLPTNQPAVPVEKSLWRLVGVFLIITGTTVGVAIAGPSFQQSRLERLKKSKPVATAAVPTANQRQLVKAQPPADSAKLKWDFDNKLQAVDTDNDGIKDVEYIYDALGRRVGRKANGQTTVFVQADQQTVADYVLGTSPNTPTQKYVYGDYVDELVMRDGVHGQHYFHQNQQYSTTAMTDSTGAVVERYAYDAYGSPTFFDSNGNEIGGSTYTNRHTYTGREWDHETGMYHYRARPYHPEMGRFVSRDPIGYEDGMNQYQYLMSHPTDGLDPTGTKLFANSTGKVTKQDALKCCQQYLDTYRSKTPKGWVMCCKGEYITCANFKSTQNKKADDIIAGCVNEHEKKHFPDVKPCLDKRVETQCYRPGWEPKLEDDEDKQSAAECRAYETQIKCLLKNITKCGSDSECIKKVRKEIDDTRKAAIKSYGCKGLPK